MRNGDVVWKRELEVGKTKVHGEAKTSDDKVEIDSLWEEEPVDFKTFVESPNYANHIPLTPVQYKEVYRMCGDDPKKMFVLGRPNIEGAWIWGKGSLSYDSTVLITSSGQWCKIGELAGKGGQRVCSFDLESRSTEVREVNDFWCEAPKGHMYQVTFTHGTSIVVQENHRFWSRFRYRSCTRSLGNLCRTRNAKWTECQDLSPGDAVAVAGTIPEPTKPCTQPIDELVIVAYAVSEGCYPVYKKDRYDLQISNTDEVILHDCKNSLEHCGFTFSERIEQVNRKKAKTTIRLWSTKDSTERMFIEKYGLLDKRSGNKIIPPQVFALPNSQLAIFLSRLFAGDGWGCFKKKPFEVGYASKSYQLCLDVHRLLLRFGIFSRISKKSLRQGDYYSLKINGRGDLSRFVNNIGIFGRDVPDNVKLFLASDVNGYRYVRENDIVWTKVKSVEYVGEQPYYDTHVPGLENFVADGVIGHNSGKGTTSTLLESYCIYLHLCMKDPHAYYRIAKADPLYFVNVATTGEQSGRLFKRLAARLIYNRWFSKRYLIRSEGRVLNKDVKEQSMDGKKGIIQLSVQYTSDSVEIARRCISFPKGLEAIAVTSRTSGYEDITMVFGLFDEASGFTTSDGYYNAEDIYNTLRMTTRNLPAFILMTSWPRLDEEHDFLFVKYKAFLEAEKKARADGVQPTQFGSLYSTWDVLPEQYADKFEVEINVRTHQKALVPTKLRDAFDPENPVAFAEAKRKFMCIPGGLIEHGYEDHPDKVLNAIKTYAPRIETELDWKVIGDTTYSQHTIKKLLLNKNLLYFIGIDQSQERAETAIIISHLERPEEQNKLPRIVVDSMIVYPTRVGKNHVSVDLVDVLNLIKYLCHTYNIAHLRADHWNSAVLERMLKEIGVKVTIKECRRPEFDFVRELIHKDRLWLPADDQYGNSTKFVNQWNTLITPVNTTMKKPKCPPPMLMDVVDAVVECCVATKDWFAVKDNIPTGMVLEPTIEQAAKSGQRGNTLPPEIAKKYIQNRPINDNASVILLDRNGMQVGGRGGPRRW